MLSLEEGGRRRRRRTVIAWICFFVFVSSITVEATQWFKPFNVTYDHRALILDGHRRMLISAGIHYPRATPEVFNSFFPKFNFFHLISIITSLGI
jgi:hypothetical protein